MKDRPRHPAGGHWQTAWRTSTAILLLAAILSPLASSSPAEALELDIFNPPTGLVESPYSFVVAMSSPPEEHLQARTVHISIYKADDRGQYEATLEPLPLTSGTATYGVVRSPFVVQPAGTVSTVITTAAKDLAYVYYSISWVAPAHWPQGQYRIEVRVTATLVSFSRTSSFTLYLGDYPAQARPMNIYNIVDPVTAMFTKTVALQSPDGNVSFIIQNGTKAVTANNFRLGDISVVPVTRSPLPGSGGMASVIYDIGPSRATFSPPVSLTISYQPQKIPSGFTERNLVLAYYDLAANQWVLIEGSVVNPDTSSVTAPVSHFTPFAVMPYKAPASFAAANLTIEPPQVPSGDNVTVGVTITNNGDVSGSQSIVLTVDGSTYASKPVTLDGKSSERVTFSVSRTAPGSHSVAVAGLSGTFRVTPPPAPTTSAPPAVPTVTSTPSPSPTPPPPAPPQPPRPPPAPTAIELPPPPPTVSEWTVIGAFGAIAAISLLILWVLHRRRIL